MGLLAEGFTILAVLEARDKASEIFEKCGGVLEKFGEDAQSTADAVKAAADEIDESLASTASGVDPLELAAAKVAAAEDQMAASTEALAAAQQRLMAVSGSVATQEEMGAAAENVAVAEQRAAAAATEQAAALAAQREALAAAIAESDDLAAATGLQVDAQGLLRDAQGRFVTAAEAQESAQAAVTEGAAEGSAALTALAEANERVASAEKLNADATAEASAAQARQDALASSDDVAAAASSLTAAEKGAASASKDLSAAQSQQAAVQKAVAMSSDKAKAAALAQSAADKEAAENSKALSGAVGGIGKVAGITAIGMGLLGAVAVKAAGNFQSLTAHLVTDAGESASNLGMIRAGILSISSATGTSATDITNAMYHIESAGIHGAAGLAVAKVAAEGAKVGGADLDTVSKTLVGTLNSYGMTSKNSAVQTQYATQMMNMLVATVGSGDMRMQDLASSLGSVTPLASAAGLSFAQVGGAVATMTSQNMTAQRATQDLDNLLRNIVKPSKDASTEMRYLGISANQVSTSLKGQGLTGVMNEFTTAILKNTQGGMVSLGFYKQMTPATQALAQGILAGKVSTLDLTNAMKSMTPQQAQIITQFKAAAVSATGLKQTYTGALATLTGGATGLNTSLMLTGKNAGVFAGNVAKIAAEGKKAGTSVDNWSTIQGTFNQKVDVAKTAVENTGIAIGSALLPAAATLFSVISKIVVPVAEWTAKHKTLTAVLFVGVTALAATVAVLVLVGKTFKAVSSGINEVKKAYNGAVSVLQKLAGKSKSTADQQASDAKKTAGANERASEQSAAAAQTAAGEEEAASGEAAAAAETDAGETAAANETAAAESSGSWWTAAGQQIAAAASWVAQSAVKVATAVGSYVAGAATTLGAWVATGAGMVGQAAIWVAQTVAKVAVVVGSNVAGAAVAMGAWIAANAVMLLGIGLIVAAVVIAVVLIIKYWKQISAAAVAVWHDLVSGAETAFHTVLSAVETVIGWVRSHWPLLLAILTGPIGLAVLFITKHWDQIRNGASEMIGDLVRFFTGLPGRILSAVSGLAGMLYHAGVNAIKGLISGAASMVSGAVSTVEGWGHDIANALGSPFGIHFSEPSEASQMVKAGRNIPAGLAKGMTAGTGDVASAAGKIASAVTFGRGGSLTAGIGSSLALSAASAAGGGAGTMNVTIDLRGGVIASDASMNQLATKVGNQVVRQLGQAGVKVRMG